jgi:hypothetical protein
MSASSPRPILAIVIAAPAFVLSATAQRMDPGRERTIQECTAMQKRDSHDL